MNVQQDRDRTETIPPHTPSCPDVVADAWTGCTFEFHTPWRKSAVWRQDVQRRIVLLYDELARLNPESARGREERCFLIDKLLADAYQASLEPSQSAYGGGIVGLIRRPWMGISKWWSGTEIERAWARLREVEERTIDLLPVDELEVRATDTSAYGHRYLPGDDPRLAYLDGLRLEAATARSRDGIAPLDERFWRQLRASMVDVLRKAHAAVDRANQEARYLRNRIILSSLLGIFFGVVIVATQAWTDHAFIKAPEGWTHSSWRLMLLVMTFGAIGALMTAIPAMTKIPADFGPFNLPLQQSMLKIVLGPISAAVGLAILNTEPLESGPPTTWPALVLTAIAFGAAQQAVTRYVDQRAGAILDAASPTGPCDR